MSDAAAIAEEGGRFAAPEQTLVVDIGGTTTRLARIDWVGGGLANTARRPTANYLTHPKSSCRQLFDELLRQLQSYAAGVFGNNGPESVIVAYPGPITAAGIALRSPTIFGPERPQQQHVCNELQRLWPRARIRVLNDLTGAGYCFVQRGYKEFCVLTVGSGIGNKVFRDGRPQIDDEGYAGEIGHLQMAAAPASPVADVCGELGSISSGRGTVALAKCWAERRPQDFALSSMSLAPDAEALACAFRSGDVLAQNIVRAAAHPLAVAIGALHLGLGLSKFFIVGGFAKALGQEYQRLLTKIMREVTWDMGQKWTDMIELGEDDAEEALLGGAFLAQRDQQTRAPTSGRFVRQAQRAVE